MHANVETGEIIQRHDIFVVNTEMSDNESQTQLQPGAVYRAI